jgi:Ca-activated chloride channel homolog
MRMRYLIIAAMLFLADDVFAQTKQIRTGNKLYQEKKYKEAANAYQQALVKNPGYTPGMFNLGNAMFQQKNYDASRQVMTATAKQAKDKTMKANANYNIGNTYMQEQKWQEAIDAYKQALKNNPQDEAAKYNLSYALAMMKKQQGGGGKDNQKNKDQKDKDDKNKQDQQDQNKDQQKKDQEQQDQQKQDEQNKDSKNQEEKKPESQESKLSEKQAEQLLNALAQEEKKLHDKKEKGKAVKIKVEKDW